MIVIFISLRLIFPFSYFAKLPQAISCFHNWGPSRVSRRRAAEAPSRIFPRPSYSPFTALQEAFDVLPHLRSLVGFLEHLWSRAWKSSPVPKSPTVQKELCEKTSFAFLVWVCFSETGVPPLQLMWCAFTYVLSLRVFLLTHCMRSHPGDRANSLRTQRRGTEETRILFGRENWDRQMCTSGVLCVCVGERERRCFAAVSEEAQ